MPPHVVLRADATSSSGVGHIMRTLTLGLALRRLGCTIELVTTGLVATMETRAATFGVPVIRSETTPGGSADADLLVSRGADFVVVDGYFFSATFFDRLTLGGVRHLVIDDNRESRIDTACVVLNQNLHATARMYPDIRDEASLLLGPGYALIRDEVRRLRDLHLSSEDRKVLVSLGGTDPLGLTAEISENLARIPGIDLVVAGGSDSPHWRPAAADIARDLASSTVAVVGAGTSIWESCCLGTPVVAIIVADNQVAAASAAQENGVALTIDSRSDPAFAAIRQAVAGLIVDVPHLAEMSNAGRTLIDGSGAERVANAAMGALNRVGS